MAKQICKDNEQNEFATNKSAVLRGTRMSERAGDNNRQNSETNAILGVLAQSRRLRNKRRILLLVPMKTMTRPTTVFCTPPKKIAAAFVKMLSLLLF